MDNKKCVKCEEIKYLSEFPKKIQRQDGYDTRCKEWVNQLNRERAAAKKLQDTSDYPDHKKCNNCLQEKILKDFPVDSSGKYGRKGRCSDCCNESQRDKYEDDDQWRKQKQDKNNKYGRKKYNEDIEHRENKLMKIRQYRSTEVGKQVRRDYDKNRYDNDIHYKVHHNTKSLIYNRLRNRNSGKDNRSTFDILPYTLEELIEHLESKFKPDMTWDNYGEWHIDHIQPDVSFNYTSVDDPEIQKCWALSNLQPLWAEENLSKGARNA